jgi:hypothetical protein
MARKPTLDNAKNQSIVLDQIDRQRGLETGVWELVNLEERSYYAYKAKHEEFHAKVEAIREKYSEITPPYNDKELQKRAVQVLTEYVNGGFKTRQIHRTLKPIPLFEQDGVTPRRNKLGHRMYDYEEKEIREILYENGFNEKAYNKVFPEERLTEKSLKFCLASIVQDVQEQPIPDAEKIKLYDYLRGFKERALLELAASWK